MVQAGSVEGRTRLGPLPPLVKGGSRHFHAVLVEDDIPEIRALYRAGVGYKEIAEKLDVSEECVRHVLIGKTWGHIPDPLGPVMMRRRGHPPRNGRLSILDWDQVAEIRAPHGGTELSGDRRSAWSQQVHHPRHREGSNVEDRECPRVVTEFGRLARTHGAPRREETALAGDI